MIREKLPDALKNQGSGAPLRAPGLQLLLPPSHGAASPCVRSRGASKADVSRSLDKAYEGLSAQLSA